MRRHAPDVGDYMTHLPVEAEKCETVAEAVVMMNEHRIHHLPVMNGSHFKGLVSLNDILRTRAGGSWSRRAGTRGHLPNRRAEGQPSNAD